MNYKELKLDYSYETKKTDMINDFYIPVLSNAKRYDRIAGFFSSTALAIAAKGIAGLIANKGTMRMIACPSLSKEDADVISKSIDNQEEILSKCLINELSDIEDSFKKNHIEALGWMLANGYLDMKIALVKGENGRIDPESVRNHPIVHQKVGILYDSDFNAISFSGSNNESASGWLGNIEEFKVFKQWEPVEDRYFETDRNKFEEYWNNTRVGVEVKDLPEAVKDELISISRDFDIDKISLQKYQRKKSYFGKEKEELSLFYYQQDALNKWIENDKRLLLEMATGCGKTRTAIGCMKRLIEDAQNPILIVVACPQVTLAAQWKTEIEKLDISIDESIVCDGNSNWKSEFRKLVNQLSLKKFHSMIVYTTHVTCSKDEFLSIVSKARKIQKFLVGDEVHGMGAAETKKSLIEEYDYRLGLSATPSRWFDEVGTKYIEDYFGNDSYKFTIEQALSTINPVTSKSFLVNYYYHPRFIQLSDEELEEYKKLSDKITKMSRSKDDSELEQALSFLLFRRADIEKNAANKYAELDRILDDIGPDIRDTIVFVSAEQLSHVLKQIGSRGISTHEFTMDQGTKPMTKYGGKSERDYIIDKFKSGEYQVLIAIKCLDEGIDIPSASRAIVMASSTNPREYIQRIGRVIRQAPGKTEACIYDMIIRPDLEEFQDPEFAKLEKRIFKKELDRVEELSKNAYNNSKTLKTVYEIIGGMI